MSSQLRRSQLEAWKKFKSSRKEVKYYIGRVGLYGGFTYELCVFWVASTRNMARSNLPQHLHWTVC